MCSEVNTSLKDFYAENYFATSTMLQWKREFLKCTSCTQIPMAFVHAKKTAMTILLRSKLLAEDVVKYSMMVQRGVVLEHVLPLPQELLPAIILDL